MALQRQVNQFLFSQGSNSRLTPEALPPEKLTILENAVIDKLGALRHKPGSDSVSSSIDASGMSNIPATLDTAETIQAYNSTPIVITRNARTVTNPISAPSMLYAYDSNQNKWRPSQPDARAYCVMTDYFTAGLVQSRPSWCDCVLYNGLLYVVATNDIQIEFLIVDPVSKLTLATLFSTSNVGSRPSIAKVCQLNGKIYMLYSDVPPSTNLYALQYDPAVGGGVTSQVVVNNILTTIASTACVYDFHIDENNVFYLAYKNSAASTVTVNSYTSLTSGAPATPLPTVNTTTLATVVGGNLTIFGSRSLSTPTVFVAYTTATNNSCVVYGLTTALGASFGPHTPFSSVNPNAVRAIVGSTSVYNNKVCLYLSIVQTLGTVYVGCLTQEYTPTGVGIGTTFVNNYWVYSKPRNINGFDYMVFYNYDLNQTGYHLATTAGLTMTGQQFTVVGKIFNGEGGISAEITPDSVGDLRHFCPSITSSDSRGNYYCMGGKIISEYASTSKTFTPAILSFNPTANTRWLSSDLADSINFVGGVASMYDGDSFYELNFPRYPSTIFSTFNSTPGTGSVTAGGTYSLAFVYEFIDANGKVHLSAPSEPKAITTGVGTNMINYWIAVNILGLTSKPNFNLLVYRTTNGGSVFYFDHRKENVGTSLSGVAVGSCMVSDATLQSQAILYTDSGELANSDVWGVRSMDIYKDRLFCLTPDGLYYSKKIELGDPVEFAGELNIPLESTGGDAVAVATLQDKLLIFKQDRTYIVYGDGPNDTGTYGDFSQPQVINKTIGCINASSIASDGEFVYFQSRETICRINSSLQIEKIGNDLDYFLNSQPTIRTVSVLPKQRQIRFSDQARTYIFFTEAQQWGVWYHGSAATISGALSSTVINDQYYFIPYKLTPPNIVYKEDETSLEDYSSASVAPYTIATSWIRLESVQGFQRLYSIFILGRKRGAHNLTIKIMYDYVPVVVETHTINESSANSYIYTDANLFVSDSVPSGTDQTNKQYQYRIKTARQKVQAVRLLISDDASPGSPAFAGTVDLIAAAFEMGVKRLSPKMWIGDGRTV